MSFWLKNIIIIITIVVEWAGYVCHSVPVEVREQLYGTGFILYLLVGSRN